MANTFYFYDLETTGVSPRTSRIMQFAGQRTNLDLVNKGNVFSSFIKITPDILPEPDAVLFTKITPQQTIADGINEAEFLKLFYKEAVLKDTVIVGYNNVRFDDEFIRYINYRNFYDPYEWQWKNGCSRWDMLDVVRMTRALRPDGIKWPFDSSGKPTNRLGFLTAINKIPHDEAHDAKNDVSATIEIAKLIKNHQPDLFNYLLSLRSKQNVSKLVEAGEPFVYTSSHYSSSILHTSVVYTLTPHKSPGSALVFDLRQDPNLFLDLKPSDLIKIWRYTEDPESLRLPIKTLKYNRVPAIAPLGVIKDKKTRDRLGIDLEIITSHLNKLKARQNEFANKMLQVVDKLDEIRSKEQASLIDNEINVDQRLYDGFFNDSDRLKIQKLRNLTPDALVHYSEKFTDNRLNSLLPHYISKNYPKFLDSKLDHNWQKYCRLKLTQGGQASMLNKYFARIEELKKTFKNKSDQYILEELNLYGQSVVQHFDTNNDLN